LGPINKMEKIAFALNKEKNTIATVWKDKTMVYFVSNQFGTNIDTVMRKQEGNLQKSPMNVPLVAKDYSENGMQHVDTFNTAMKNQWAKYKNFTWRRAHLLTMFKISFVNSWIIYKKIHNQNIKQGDFLILL